MIIAIDGPAGSGKTTVSRTLADRLNISYLDTGATFRTLTLKSLRENVDLEDYRAVEEIAVNLDIKFVGNRIYLDGEDVSEDIRTPFIDKNVSKIASNPLAREVLKNVQRKIVDDKDFVVEGRDITTVVFPNAEVKFYLDADTAVRAGRRHKELSVKGVEVSLDETKTQIQKRDDSDFNRSTAPLTKAEDAIYINTTTLTVEEVVNELISHINKYKTKFVP